MTPNKTGIWEWFDADDVCRLVFVWNVFEKYPNQEPHFRVYWRGGYYDTVPEAEDTKQERFNQAGWSGGTWGKFVGNYEDFKEEELFI